jgi:hypothetical protein
MGEYLTDIQRKQGQHHYFSFSMFNGVSVTFVAENLLILYALKLNVPDYIIGIMSSFIFMSAPFMLLSRPSIRHFGAAKTIAFAWIARYSFAMIFMAAPLIISHYSFYLGVVVLLICAFGFYASRNIGVVAWTPVLGEITTEKDKSNVLSKGFFAYTFSYLISLCLLRFLFEFQDSINTFRGIIAIGCIAGFWAAYTISKIHETDMPKISAGHSLKEAVLYIKSSRQIIILIAIQMIYFASIALIVPYSMLALKEGYFVQDYNAVTFVIIQMGGGVIVSIFGKKVLDNVNIKYVIVGLFSMFLIASAMWIFAPQYFQWWFCLIIFFILGIARIGGFMALAHYFLAVTPPEMRVGINLVLSVISYTVAGVAGAVVGGGILKYLESYGLHALDLYHYYFIIMLLISLIGFVLILCLERVNPIKTLIIARRIFIK